METYYVSTSDGRVHQIDGVTDVEIVVNDGVATEVYDGVWRNVIPFPFATNSQPPMYGPGWTMTPDKNSPFARQTTADELLMRPRDAADTVMPDIFTDDVINETEPRFLKVKKSYWRFTTASAKFFFPLEVVVGMSNNPPTY